MWGCWGARHRCRACSPDPGSVEGLAQASWSDGNHSLPTCTHSLKRPACQCALCSLRARRAREPASGLAVGTACREGRKEYKSSGARVQAEGGALLKVPLSTESSPHSYLSLYNPCPHFITIWIYGSTPSNISPPECLPQDRRELNPESLQPSLALRVFS